MWGRQQGTTTRDRKSGRTEKKCSTAGCGEKGKEEGQRRREARKEAPWRRHLRMKLLSAVVKLEDQSEAELHKLMMELKLLKATNMYKEVEKAKVCMLAVLTVLTVALLVLLSLRLLLLSFTMRTPSPSMPWPQCSLCPLWLSLWLCSLAITVLSLNVCLTLYAIPITTLTITLLTVSTLTVLTALPHVALCSGSCCQVTAERRRSAAGPDEHERGPEVFVDS